MTIKLFYILFLLVSMVSYSYANTLPPSVLAALHQAKIPIDHVGVEVRLVNARTPLISVNNTRPMNPASTMKLLTTYAGLELLGPAYRWKTEVWIDGELKNGVLQGDLILKGYGDPKLTVDQFWLWLRELRGRGLREIRGNVLIDRSTFQLAPHDPAAFDNDPLRAYNVGPDALLLNFDAIKLHLIPEKDGIRIMTEPELYGISIDNRLRMTAKGRCRNWDDRVFPTLSGNTLLVQGSFAASCGERAIHVSLLGHARFMNVVFRALWKELGGTVRGKLRDGILPIKAKLFASHSSESLAELIRDINKYSNNVMARQLFLSLSLFRSKTASIALSKKNMHDWLLKKKLNFPELKLENGAGLSRTALISPHSMAQLLQSAQTSPMQPEFEGSLPIPGVDGTLRKRLRRCAATSHGHLKTGSLNGVKTIAGYVQDVSGKKWIVVFYINDARAWAGRKAQDALIEWVQSK